MSQWAKKIPKCWMPVSDADRSAIVLPNPLPRDIADTLSSKTGWAWTNPYLVRRDSPPRARYAVECMARYFRREFGYDFVQYTAEGNDHDEHDVAVLWCAERTWEGDGRPVGAACFRWRHWQNRPPCHALAWVWFHPFFRGDKGGLRDRTLFAGVWPKIRGLFPTLAVEPPFSKAMIRFLEKMGELFDGDTVFLLPRAGVAATLA